MSGSMRWMLITLLEIVDKYVARIGYGDDWGG